MWCVILVIICVYWILLYGIFLGCCGILLVLFVDIFYKVFCLSYKFKDIKWFFINCRVLSFLVCCVIIMCRVVLVCSVLIYFFWKLSFWFIYGCILLLFYFDCMGLIFFWLGFWGLKNLKFMVLLWFLENNSRFIIF